MLQEASYLFNDGTIHGREADHFFARKWARARAHDHFSFPRDKLCLNLYFFLLASGNCKINIFASE